MLFWSRLVFTFSFLHFFFVWCFFGFYNLFACSLISFDVSDADYDAFCKAKQICNEKALLATASHFGVCFSYQYIHTHTPLFRSYLTSLVLLSSLSTLWLSRIDIRTFIQLILQCYGSVLCVLLHSLSVMVGWSAGIFLSLSLSKSSDIVRIAWNSIERCCL